MAKQHIATCVKIPPDLGLEGQIFPGGLTAIKIQLYTPPLQITCAINAEMLLACTVVRR